MPQDAWNTEPVDIEVPTLRPRTMMVDELVFSYVPYHGGRTRRPLKLNLMYPRSTPDHPIPVLVFLCGGAWMEMDKDLWIPELVPITRRGIAVACAEYRTSEAARFPAQLEDVKAAIRYLRAHAEQWNLDPDHIAVMGESAGGHLAILAGTTGHLRTFDTGAWLEQDSSVQAVVDYYGPTDFAQMADYPSDMDHNAADAPEALLIGGPVQENPDLVKKANPITYLTPDAPPFLILHGTDDRTVPCHQSDLLYDALKSKGVPVDYYRLAGEGHATDAFVQPEIMERVSDFLARTLTVD